jgi:hypothetical protein
MSEKDTTTVESTNPKSVFAERSINFISAAITIFQTFFAFPQLMSGAKAVPYLQNLQFSLKFFVFTLTDISSAYFVGLLLSLVNKVEHKQTHSFLYLILMITTAFISLSFIDIIVFKGIFSTERYVPLYILSYIVTFYFMAIAESEQHNRILAQKKINEQGIEKQDKDFMPFGIIFLLTFFYVIMFVCRMSEQPNS